MIEIIYDKTTGEKTEMVVDDSTKNLKKLPKNIRQIGNPPENKRIYIEDYVVSYLNYIGRPNCVKARGAILLGSIEETIAGRAIFISGAVNAPNLEFDMNESEFTKEAWSSIYEEIKKYFPEREVVGWYLSRMGFSTVINEKIQKMHVENFPGKDRVLYVTDTLECEDAFYVFQKGQLVRQNGYYVYYSKNEEMQNYIIDQKDKTVGEGETEIIRKDTEIVKNFRDKNDQVREDKMFKSNLAYVAGSFVVVAMLALGITVVSNKDKMDDMEISINRLELTAESGATEAADNALAVDAVIDNDDKPSKEENALNQTLENVTEEATTEQLTENVTEEAAKETTKEQDVSIEPVSKESSEEISVEPVSEKTSEEISIEPVSAQPAEEMARYTIQKGDSLTRISCIYYGTPDYANKIAEANGLEKDKIFEGVEIIIPAID